MTRVDFGKAMRVLRAQRGIQQGDVAKALKIDKSYVSLLEHGKRAPSIDVLQRAAKFYRVKLSELVHIAEDL